MVERPQKSVLKAYVLLFLLGVLGGHRYYMKRPGTGLGIAVLSIVSIGLLVVALGQEDSKSFLYGAYLCGALVLAALIADIIMIPGMIEELNNPGEERRISVIAGNLDPSFQATLRHAGREASNDKPRKSALPEDYVRPWHKKKETETDIYRVDGDDKSD